MHRKIISASEVSKSGSGDSIILKPASFDVGSGFTAIVGPSGAGKSTLATMLHGLIHPSSGEIAHVGVVPDATDYYRNLPEKGSFRQTVTRAIRLETAEDKALSTYRAKYLGYIAQNPALNPYMTAEQSIRLPHNSRGTTLDEDYLAALVDRFGMGQNLSKRPNELSGGEQQRTAIIAALAHKPNLIMADEPTSNLDSGNSAVAMEVFRDITAQTEASVIFVSHDPRISDYADYTIRVRDATVFAA